jgi:hypothetical protein
MSGRNVFEQEKDRETGPRHTLSHDAMRGIATDAVKRGSLKEAVEDYAFKHGIEDIDVLFPDARNVTDTPEWDARRTEWVAEVLGKVRKSPFSRIKSIVADITHAEARAKGYIKGTLKKEEYFGLTKRVTTPSTVYKKQKLDRDDIIDITDFDVVMWLKGEMRLMLDEEIARAILIGDGRDIDDEDKIRDPKGATDGAGIRSILFDDDLYAAKITIDVNGDLKTRISWTRSSETCGSTRVRGSRRSTRPSPSPPRCYWPAMTWAAASTVPPRSSQRSSAWTRSSRSRFWRTRQT